MDRNKVYFVTNDGVICAGVIKENNTIIDENCNRYALNEVKLLILKPS